MRRSRSQLNNLAYSSNDGQGMGYPAQTPIGANRQTDEMQRRINSINPMGMQQQQMMPEMYAPQPYPQMASPYSYHQPAYADFPTPMHMPQVHNPELDHMRASIEKIGAQLSSLNSQNMNGSGNQQQAQALIRQNEQITAELLEMRKLMSSQPAQGSDIRAEMEAIRQALEANYGAISNQLASNASSSNDIDKFALAVEASHEKLADQLRGLQSEVNGVTGNSDIFSRTLEARHDEVANRIAHLQESVNAAMANPDLYAEKVAETHNNLVSHVEELKQAIASVEASSSQVQTPDLSNVEMRLEEITRAVVALSAGDQNVDNLERIEARIGDLAKTVSNFKPTDNNDYLNRIEAEIASLKTSLVNDDKASSLDQSAFEAEMQQVRSSLNQLNDNFAKANASPKEGFAEIAEQINILSEKLENRDSLNAAIASADGSGADHSALITRMDALVENISNIKQAPVDVPEIDYAAIGSMLDNGPSKEIASRLDTMAYTLDQITAVTSERNSDQSAPDYSADFLSLENQLSDIVSQLGNNGGERISFEPIAERLDSIEQQLSASRDIAIDVASQAAKEAVEHAISELPASGGEGGIAPDSISNLSHDIKRWHESISSANSENSETFESVRDALNILADRLSNIEDSIKSGETYQFGPTGETTIRHDFANEPVIEETAPPPPSPDSVLESVFSNQANHGQEEQDFYHADHEEHQQHQAHVENAYQPEYAEQAPAHEPLQQEAYEPAAQMAENTTNPLFQAAVQEAARNEQQVPVDAQHLVQTQETQVLTEDQTPSMAMSEVPEVSAGEQHQDHDVPLEPGSGAPDLAALVKQANERRKSNAKNGVISSGSDFLASARRAAQAAAQEASIAEEQYSQRETEKSGKERLLDFVQARKKILVIGASAVLLIAAALPLASQFIGGSSNNNLTNQQPVIEQNIAPASDSNSVFGSKPSNSEAQITDDAAPEVSLNNDDGVVNSIEPSTFGNDDAENDLISEVDLSQTDAKEQVSISQTQQNDVAQFDVSELTFTNDALKQAVAEGDPVALFEIGRLYSEGVGTQQDPVKAAQWYERSANLGYAPAQYTTANFYEKSIGVEKNIEKAISWYELAAEGGNIVAMHNLGVIHASPNTVSEVPDMTQAYRWFNRAAEAGVRDSQVNMGIFYTKGIGTDVDLVSAYKWFSIAATGNDKDAQSKLEVITDALRPDQLEAAKAMVASWSPATMNVAANEVKVPDVWKSNNAVAANKAAPKKANISKETVAQMQAILSGLGYNPGPADGVMGQRTRDAIAKFQKSAGLDVNGNVNAELLRSLTKAVSERS